MDAAAAGLNIRATPAVATPAQSAQRQQASGATAAGATAIAGGATGGGGDVTSSSSRRPGSGFTSKRSRPWPLLTAQQLADDTPSRRAGIPAKRERAFYRNLYSLVKEGGQALALAQQTTTTALLFGFRYFALRSFSKSDRFVVGAAALFLAAKARDELRPLDAVVTACLKVREAQGGGGGKKKGSAAAAGAEGSGSVAASPMYTPTPTPGQGGGSASALPSPASRTAAAIAAASLGGPSTLTAQLADKAYMSSLKEAVLTAERALLYVLGFELDLELPHEALMASLALLRKSEDPAVAEFWADPKHTQVALSFINDSFRTSLCLMHDWAHVGVGALVAVVDKLGGPAPVVSLAGGSWSGSRSGGGSGGTTTSRSSRPRFFWELVPSCSDMTPELLDDVVRIISGMYEQAPPAAPAPAGAAAGAAAAGSRKRRTGEGGEGGEGDGGDAGGGGGEGAKRVKTEQGAGPSATAAAVAAPPVVDATNVVKQGRQDNANDLCGRTASPASGDAASTPVLVGGAGVGVGVETAAAAATAAAGMHNDNGAGPSRLGGGGDGAISSAAAAAAGAAAAVKQEENGGAPVVAPSGNPASATAAEVKQEVRQEENADTNNAPAAQPPPSNSALASVQSLEPGEIL